VLLFVLAVGVVMTDSKVSGSGPPVFLCSRRGFCEGESPFSPSSTPFGLRSSSDFLFLLSLNPNTAQVYRLQAGERLASVAIRRLRRQRQRELGSAPAVLYVAGCYGVFSLEELLDVLGSAPRESLLPTLAKPSSPDSPT
jgi:hypothetical protein